jgi:cyclic pyranopterin phosphate synthase
MKRLTHADRRGRARMVDVSAKPATAREAVARAIVRMRPQTQALVRANRVAKGNVLEVAQLAGVMAAKRTAELIPLCHPIPLTDVQVRVEPAPRGVAIEAHAKTVAPTGVEMEALVAAAVAALAVYDMCKAADRGMTIDRVRLVLKRGGRRGTYRRPRER